MILEVPWDDLWTLSLDSHNFMVTALGSCVKWSLECPIEARKRGSMTLCEGRKWKTVKISWFAKKEWHEIYAIFSKDGV